MNVKNSGKPMSKHCVQEAAMTSGLSGNMPQWGFKKPDYFTKNNYQIDLSTCLTCGMYKFVKILCPI